MSDIHYDYLENTQDGHSKFYIAAALDAGPNGVSSVLLRWGKIGTKGQESTYTSSDGTFTTAHGEALSKRNAKIRGGYLVNHSNVIPIQTGMTWDECVWQDIGSGLASANVKKVDPLVTCSSCGNGGWELTGWGKGPDGVICPNCKLNLGATKEDKAAALLAMLEG